MPDIKHTFFASIFLLVGIIITLLIVPILLPFLGIGLIFLTIIPTTRPYAKNKAIHIWLAYDKLWNALLFHHSGETISSRLGKSLYHGHPPVFNWRSIDALIGGWLDKVDPDHCRNSIDWNIGRGSHWQRRRSNLSL